jgi:hypothetical protein
MSKPYLKNWIISRAGRVLLVLLQGGQPPSNQAVFVSKLRPARSVLAGLRLAWDRGDLGIIEKLNSNGN